MCLTYLLGDTSKEYQRALHHSKVADQPAATESLCELCKQINENRSTTKSLTAPVWTASCPRGPRRMARLANSWPSRHPLFSVIPQPRVESCSIDACKLFCGFDFVCSPILMFANFSPFQTRYRRSKKIPQSWYTSIEQRLPLSSVPFFQRWF